MPTKTYNENIPDGPNNPADDQPLMKVNTNSIASILGGDSTVDMIGFNDLSGGWHRKITFVNQGANPGSAATQYVEYSKQSAGQSELFTQKDGTATPIQLTRGVPGTSGSASYSYLPGGFLIQWGSQLAVGNVATVTFPVAFTASPTSVTANVRNLAGVYQIASIQIPSNTSVNINTSGANQTVYWIAIGV